MVNDETQSAGIPITDLTFSGLGRIHTGYMAHNAQHEQSIEKIRSHCNKGGALGARKH